MSDTFEVLSAVHGIAPRSNELLLLGTDIKRGRVSQEAFYEQIDQETEAWLSLQAEAGIDLRENGKLRWQDHLQPIVKATTGFAPDITDAPLTRWFEDNRFYRQPTVVGELSLDGEAFASLTGTPGESISLVGPQTFLGLANSTLAPGETARAVEKLYDQLCAYYASQGVKQILFEEYAAGYLPAHDTIQLNSFMAVVEELGINIAKIPSKIFEPGVLSPATNQWSYGQQKGKDWQVTTIVNAIDAGNTAKDPCPAITFDHTGRYILTHTVDLEKIPLKHAQDKVKRLGEFTAKLRGELGAAQ